MTFKILVVALCAALGTAAGYIIMKSYKRKTSYMSGLCALIGELKRNISYRRDAAASVAEGFSLSAESGLLKKHIDEYKAFVAAKNGELILSRSFLSKDAYSSVCSFFTALGKTDEASQLDELEMYYKDFSERLAKASAESERYGALAVKLGFLLGLGVGVLFL